MNDTERQTHLVRLENVAIQSALLLPPGGLVLLMLVNENPAHWLVVCGVIGGYLGIFSPVARKHPCLRYWSLGWLTFAVSQVGVLLVHLLCRQTTTLDILAWYVLIVLIGTVASLWLPRDSAIGLVPIAMASVQYAVLRDFHLGPRSLASAAMLLVVVTGTFRLTSGFEQVRRAVCAISGVGLLGFLAFAWPTVLNFFVFPQYLPMLLALASLPCAAILVRVKTGDTHSKLIKSVGVGLLAATLAIVLLDCCRPQLASTNGQQAADPLPVLIDTDMSYDDMVALQYLVRCPDVDVVGVTTVTGVAQADDGAETARRLLALMSRHDISVVAGAEQPLSGNRQTPRWWKVITSVALRPGLPRAAPSGVEEINASEFIRQMVSSEEAVVLALGPLTNIAVAFQEPIPAKVVISGGMTTQEAKGLLDWNLWLDPQAAQYVIESASHLNLTIIPTDVTDRVTIDDAFAQRYRATSRTPDAQLVADAISALLSFSDRRRGLPLWDAVVAAVVVEPDACTEWREQAVAVQGDDDNAGYLINSGLGRSAMICWNVEKEHTLQILLQNGENDE
jgi:purine nucleosidase